MVDGLGDVTAKDPARGSATAEGALEDAVAGTPEALAQEAKPMKPSTSYIQSVARALGILELFNDRRPALTMSEVALLSGLNRATTYRFCQTLRQLGYLEDIGNGQLRPGIKAMSLAHAALASRELPELALPYMQRLKDATGETVNLGVLHDTELVFIARVPGDSLINFRFYVGTRLPAFVTTMGRAILAFLPPGEARQILARSDREALTKHTMVATDALETELERIRSSGYAVVDEELAVGLRGIAAPVFGREGTPVAAVNVSVSHPFTNGEIDSVFAPKVLALARDLSTVAAQIQHP